MKHATIYFKNSNYYVHASSKTTAGVWIAVAPFLEIPSDRSYTLGAEIVDILKYSRESVPHPTDFKTDLLSELYALAKVKNWSAFFKSTKCLSIIQENENFKLTPHRNNAATRSFHEISDASILCTQKDLDEEITRIIEVCE